MYYSRVKQFMIGSGISTKGKLQLYCIAGGKLLPCLMLSHCAFSKGGEGTPIKPQRKHKADAPFVRMLLSSSMLTSGGRNGALHLLPSTVRCKARLAYAVLV